MLRGVGRDIRQWWPQCRVLNQAAETVNLFWHISGGPEALITQGTCSVASQKRNCRAGPWSPGSWSTLSSSTLFSTKAEQLLTQTLEEERSSPRDPQARQVLDFPSLGFLICEGGKDSTSLWPGRITEMTRDVSALLSKWWPSFQTQGQISGLCGLPFSQPPWVHLHPGQQQPEPSPH